MYKTNWNNFEKNSYVPQLHSSLFYFHCFLLDRGSPLDPVADIGDLPVLVQIFEKQAVDERRLAESRLPHYH